MTDGEEQSRTSDAQSSQAIAASREARPRPACAGTALERFERQVLVFPLLVVVLACASFLFGGTCAAWQWWTAVAAVVAAPFVRKDSWRSALGAAGLFALLLFALRCLIPPLVWDDTTCPDMAVYHLPMVQLLIEGWNPVSDPLAEGITASLGLDLWGMAPLHVAFLPKTLSIFSAVAFTFVKDPYALTFPLPVLLWLTVLLSAIRHFHGFPRMMFVAAIAIVLPMVVLRMPVDLALAFASCGLLLTMQDALRRKQCDWIAMAVWATWMMNLKLNGVIATFVFGTLFVASTIWKERATWRKWIVRFALFGGIMVLFWGLISWSPLGTSWKNYGHPLYPFKTVDAERFPVRDLTWDIQIANRDCDKMGKIGRFAHAYVSPQSTIAFYRWHLNRPDFEPVCIWWGWHEFPSATVRIALWLMFGILLIFPAGRLCGSAGIFLLILVPEDMIGFLRYQPWLSALGCLAAALFAEWVDSKANNRQRRILCGFVSMGLLLFIVHSASRRVPEIECKAVECKTQHPLVRAGFWRGPIEERKRIAPFVRSFTPRYNYLKCKENHCRLLMRQSGRSGETDIEPADEIARLLGFEWEWDERKWLPGFWNGTDIVMEPSPSEQKGSDVHEKDRSENRSWVASPFGYWTLLSPETEYLDKYYQQTGSEADEDGAVTRPPLPLGEVLHAWFVTYPREVWRRTSPNVQVDPKQGAPLQ